MKRVVISSFDPETNPRDAAESIIDSINSDITTIGNIVKHWKRILKEHPDNDSAMNKIADESAFLQQHLDEIRQHYLSHKFTK